MSLCRETRAKVGPYLGERESCRQTLKRGMFLNPTYLTRKRGPTHVVTRVWLSGTKVGMWCKQQDMQHGASGQGVQHGAKRKRGASNAAFQITHHWTQVNKILNMTNV